MASVTKRARAEQNTDFGITEKKLALAKGLRTAADDDDDNQINSFATRADRP